MNISNIYLKQMNNNNLLIFVIDLDFCNSYIQLPTQDLLFCVLSAAEP